MSRTTTFLAAIVLVAASPRVARARNIEPANPNASEAARRVPKYLYNPPRRSENRLISGHLAGGAIGPTAPRAQDGGYRFKLKEIEYLHVS